MQASNQQNFLFIKTFLDNAAELLQAQDIKSPEEAKFAAAYQMMANLAPVAENACLKLNLFFGAQIGEKAPENGDVFDLASSFYRHITAANDFVYRNQTLNKYNSLFSLKEGSLSDEIAKAVNLNAYENSGMQVENRYWLSAALEAANALSEIEMRNIKERLFIRLEQMNIAENAAQELKSNGQALDKYMEGRVVSNIYGTAEDLADSRQKIDSGKLVQVLSQNIEDEFYIDSCDLSKMPLPWDEMAKAINTAQDRQLSFREKGKIIRGTLILIQPSEHDAAIEESMYRQSLGGSFFQYADKADYLESYRDDRRYRRVAASAPFWQKYQNDDALVQDDVLRNGMQEVIQGWLNRLSESIYFQGQNLANLQNEDYGGGYDLHLKGSNAEMAKRDMQESLLTYLAGVAEAAAASENFCNLIMNSSGVSADRVARLHVGDGWSTEDYKMLWLLHNSFADSYESKKDILASIPSTDNNQFMAKLENLPDSLLKYQATRALKGALVSLKEDNEEQLQFYENGLLENLAQEHPQAIAQLEDFWLSGIAGYSSLRRLDQEEAGDRLKYSVGLNLLVPTIIGAAPDEKAWEHILQDVEELTGWDKLEDKSRRFVVSLAKYYAKQAMREVSERAEKGLWMPELEESVSSWQMVKEEYEQANNSLVKVEELLLPQEEMHQDYLRFKKEAELYVAKDIDVLRGLALGLRSR